MATNLIYADGDQMSYLASELLPSSGVTAGAPVVFGKKPGVALNSEASSRVTVKHGGVFDLSVKGIDASGNLAIAAGDILYFTNGDTPKVNVKATGVRFGYALEAITSGSTDTIQVLVGY